MKIGNHTIRTPTEDPIGYPLNWRWQLAQAALEAPDGKTPRIKDADVRALIQFLQRCKKSPLKDSEMPTVSTTQKPVT